MEEESTTMASARLRGQRLAAQLDHRMVIPQ